MNRIKQVLRARLPRRDLLGSAGSLLLCAALLLLLGAQAARATTIYGNFAGTNVAFNNVQETSTFGDPEPACCFGPPTVSGNNLIFFPPNFTASAAGAGGLDQTGSQLQAQIMSTSVGFTVDKILLSEFGDAVLTGVGTAATGTFASMAGFATVLEVNNVGIVPVIIPFLGTFTPTDTLALPGDLGTTLWAGNATIDIASVVPNATKVQLSFDNDLYAFSEAGTTAKIQKKINPVTITVIPEPTTVLLLGGGLLALAATRRGRRD